ncbi:MAG TPA: hypothetical protein VJ184_06985 [Chryseolinea sp.]|nr:hypothetical protein [Chryseolinea sp.]
MKVVEIFATNVQEISQATHLVTMLRNLFPDYLINFDLDDCDKILRVESDKVDAKEIVKFMNSKDIQCKRIN